MERTGLTFKASDDTKVTLNEPFVLRFVIMINSICDQFLLQLGESKISKVSDVRLADTHTHTHTLLMELFHQDKHVIKLLFSHADGCSISLMEEIDYISILSVQLTLIGWFGKKIASCVKLYNMCNCFSFLNEL